MMSTPCWQLGGVCITHQLCSGFKFLTEVPGCKDKLNVCCFAWNKYKVRDFRDHGIGSLAMPWSLKQEFGGEGVLEVEPLTMKPRGSRKKKYKESEGEESFSPKKIGRIVIIKDNK